MKIAIVCEVLGIPNNGNTVAAYNLIDYLRKKGHQVTVICPDKEREGQEGYVVLPLTHFGPIARKIFEVNRVVLPSYDEAIFRKVFEEVDVIHVMVPLFISRKISKLAKSMGKPLTAGFHAQAENLSVHAGLMNSRLVNKLVYKWYYKNIFCRADAIHYPTQFIRDIFENEIKRKTNGYVISNGVKDIFVPTPTEKKDEFKDKFCILCTSRLSGEKNQITLINAVKKSKYADKIQIFLAGDGPYKNMLEKAGKKLPNPLIIDFYSAEDLVKLINSCDLYCHPSVVEIEAISCLEAICCGLVPLISDSPRCVTKLFAIDERCLFKMKDSSDLAHKIDYFIENPEEKDKLRERYLSERRAFSQETCMSQMEQMLIDVAGLVENK